MLQSELFGRSGRVLVPAEVSDEAAILPPIPDTLYADNQRSEHTARNARYRLQAFAAWLEERHKITDLERAKTRHILDYEASLTHLAPSSQARIVETLRGFFRWAKAEGLIERDIARVFCTYAAREYNHGMATDKDQPMSERSARLPPWLRVVLIVLGVILTGAALLLLIAAGYTQDWTGFKDFTDPTGAYHRGKTLWDWAELLIIPIALGLGVWWLNRSERENERKIAADRLHEQALQAYFDQMTELLLKRGLRASQPNAEVRGVARARTLTVLRGLDGHRKGSLMAFLSESGLINRFEKVGDVVIDLSGADLSKANLVRAELFGAYLVEANLREADLSMAYLNWANLSGADLSKANLRKADLREADLAFAVLSEANLSGANLTETSVTAERLTKAKSLKGATMPDGTKHD